MLKFELEKKMLIMKVPKVDRRFGVVSKPG